MNRYTRKNNEIYWFGQTVRNFLSENENFEDKP
ncbi:hypothetical protein MNBD_GAMMA01-2283 [hydrothermal vent metagenome]|uniref:Uncharacterized protein n=1 Tax=hydrothermal vent metagenome TaxID=652676 RepID=A0A3B0V5H6_9ZZZZ